MFNCFGQELSEINKILEISDTLEYQQEIRIYKDYSTTNAIDIIRMFRNKNNEWITYKFWYSKDFKTVTKIDQISFPKEPIGKLKLKDADLIWLNLLITNVEFLPDMEAVRYKFGKPHINLDRGERVISRAKTHILDGTRYKVYVRNGKNKNSFSFDNPESYLKHYPTIDELISYNELLSVLKKEFSF
ncbi:hypothetical protein ASE21_07915 [Flavobacterium sp. Root901]|nr:hypothetical protein ASE21_07915 [Flavobacterium sp. Root901]